MPPFSFHIESTPSEGADPAANEPIFNNTPEYRDANVVTEDEWRQFVKNGEVTESRLLSLVYKIKNNAKLSEKEEAMRSENYKNINDKLAQLKANEEAEK